MSVRITCSGKTGPLISGGLQHAIAFEIAELIVCRATFIDPEPGWIVTRAPLPL
jgi:hypothetical protein